MVKGIERREKRYVEVVADFSPEGLITPLEIIWEDGRHFIIDRVTERRRAASMKVGGYGMRYTAYVCGQPRHLWYDGTSWYVEAIVNDGVTAM